MLLTEMSLVGADAHFVDSRSRRIKCHYNVPEGVKIFFEGINRPLCYEPDGTCINKGGDMDIISIDFQGVEIAIHGDLSL